MSARGACPRRRRPLRGRDLGPPAGTRRPVRAPAPPVAAGSGHYLLIARGAYDAVGGHAAVGHTLLEDVALAQAVKRSGRRIRFRYGGDAVSTRMYRNFAQLCEGWTKNLALLFPATLRLAARRALELALMTGGLAALGAGQVEVIGVRGDDGFGFELEQALTVRGIAADRMVKARNWQTFTYTKLLNSQTGDEDQPRVDFISTRPLPADAEQTLIENIMHAVPLFDAILIADQAETSAGGVVTPAVRDSIISLAAKYPQKVFLADSRKRVHLFRKVTLKPHRDEAEAASQSLFGKVDFPALRRHLEAKVLIVTHGPKGALVLQDGDEAWAETRPVENPVDICGAGDSF